MSISDRLDETTEQAARVIGSVMSRWDMDGRPDVDGGIDTLIARTLADAGVLATEPRIEAAGREWIAFPADQIHEEVAYTLPKDANTEIADHQQFAERNPVDKKRRWVTDWEPAIDAISRIAYPEEDHT